MDQDNLKYKQLLFKRPLITIPFRIMKICITLGDVITKTYEKRGLNFGTINSSLILKAGLIVGIVLTTKALNKHKQLVA